MSSVELVLLTPLQRASGPKKCRHGHRGDFKLTGLQLSAESESKPRTHLYRIAALGKESWS